MAIKPGNFVNGVISDYGAFAGSMAEAMDQAFNQLMLTDGFEALSMDPADPDVRHRRRLFVAIARGVVQHLKARETSFETDLPAPLNVTVTPDIVVEM